MPIKKLEIDVEPVHHGRVQVTTRVTPEDKDDITRVVNDMQINQQDVIRMFLMRGVRAYLVEKSRVSLDKVERSPEIDPNRAPGA